MALAQLAMAQATLPRPPGAPFVQQQPHPLDPALEMARASLRHIQASILDYSAVLVKRLRIDGELNEHQYAFVKIRNRRTTNGHLTTPMGVYMRFLKPDSVNGREVIWVEGKNEGKLIVHEAGIKNLVRVSLDPTGYIAMRGQRYPITEIGLENLARKVVERGERDRRHQEVEVRFFRNAQVSNRVCTVMQIVHPAQRPYFDFHVARVYFDDELKIPIHYAAWSWPTEEAGQPVLEEEYTYTNVKLNVGLTDRDFDPDNPEYNFP
jgi:hypothetical protein